MSRVYLLVQYGYVRGVFSSLAKAEKERSEIYSSEDVWIHEYTLDLLMPRGRAAQIKKEKP